MASRRGRLDRCQHEWILAVEVETISARIHVCRRCDERRVEWAGGYPIHDDDANALIAEYMPGSSRSTRPRSRPMPMRPPFVRLPDIPGVGWGDRTTQPSITAVNYAKEEKLNKLLVALRQSGVCDGIPEFEELWREHERKRTVEIKSGGIVEND